MAMVVMSGLVAVVLQKLATDVKVVPHPKPAMTIIQAIRSALPTVATATPGLVMVATVNLATDV